MTVTETITQQEREEFRRECERMTNEYSCVNHKAQDALRLGLTILDALEAAEERVKETEAMLAASRRARDAFSDMADALAGEMTDCPPSDGPCPAQDEEPSPDECVDCRLKWAASAPREAV
jgi:hypothetical protein